MRFLTEADFEAHEARVCIQSGYVLDDTKRPKNYSEQQYLCSAETMQERFKDLPEALVNTVEIAKRCSLELSLGQPSLPRFPVPEGTDEAEYLRQQSFAGLERLWPTLTSGLDKKAYEDRLNTELDVIIRMEFPGYFLIVADFIQWAKSQSIPVGPGRGSGAGSLVAYCLQITMLDPLEHELLFERFLNPERVSMPDFDVDFCMDRRDEVIAYVAQRYGQPAVSQIITYGSMAAKAVIRDVGRVLSLPYGFVDKIAKLIPFELGITLDKALEQEEQLANRYKSEDEVRTLIDLAKKLEGLVRNAGKHAGGVVIASTQLTDFCALYSESSDAQAVTQFDKDDAESAGLVKFDFLGLRTLTIIHWAVCAINASRQEGEGTPLDIDMIPYDDEKTFDLLKSCATTAVFQLESRGMKDLIRRLQPDSFEEITALVALFRPGPLQSGMVDDFIDRKHGKSAVSYPHKDLSTILEPTYGVILYQEQVMQIAQVLANYSLGGADILRRAMGKKKPEEMAKQRVIFIEGASSRGIDKKQSEYIFDLMEKFAGYGFNKSHSAAYALIAYQTAYLKAHYPAQFMAAVLSSDMDNTDKVIGFIDECRSMGLVVIPPHINQGEYYFRVNDAGEIVYGLGAIKGVGQAAIEDIVEQRHAGGEYQTLFDFCERVDTHKVSRRALEPLIHSGSMDSFDQTRATLIASVNKALKSAAQKKQDLLSGQSDLFAAMDDPGVSEPVSYISAKEADINDTLQAEKACLGYYLSGHPFEIYAAEIKQIGLRYIQEITAASIGKTVKTAGLLVAKRQIITKSGKRMAVLALEDHTGKVEVTIFSRLYHQVIEILDAGDVFLVQGKLEEDTFNGGVRIIAESLERLNDYRQTHAKRIVIPVSYDEGVPQLMEELSRILTPYCQGECQVVLRYQGEKAKADIQLGRAWRVHAELMLIKQLARCCGDKQLDVLYE